MASLWGSSGSGYYLCSRSHHLSRVFKQPFSVHVFDEFEVGLLL
jgi:hypothetical protein